MNPADFAVVIGIDGYAGLRPLKAAKRDATRFSEWLIDPSGGGLPQENVRLIRSNINPGDPFGARPILQDIEEALWAMGVQRYTRLGRRLYFYFAGHGVGPAFNEVAMLLATAATGRLTNIGLTKIQSFFHDAAVFDEVVYILDCCREEQSAICTGLSFLPPTRPDRPGTNDFALLASVYRGLAHEPFDETNAARRGLMTEALIEGLRGAPGAVDTQGRITSDTIGAYVQRRVAELSDAAQVDQQADPPKPANPAIVFRQMDIGQSGRFTLTVTRGAVAQIHPLVVLLAGVETHRAPPGHEPYVQDLSLEGVYQLVVVGGGITAVVAPNMVVNGVVHVVLP